MDQYLKPENIGQEKEQIEQQLKDLCGLVSGLFNEFPIY